MRELSVNLEAVRLTLGSRIHHGWTPSPQAWNKCDGGRAKDTCNLRRMLYAQGHEEQVQVSVGPRSSGGSSVEGLQVDRGGRALLREGGLVSKATYSATPAPEIETQARNLGLKISPLGTNAYRNLASWTVDDVGAAAILSWTRDGGFSYRSQSALTNRWRYRAKAKRLATVAKAIRRDVQVAA